MTTDQQERQFYEVARDWEEFTFSPMIAKKLQTLTEMIPPSTTRILDLGCGNGLITNRLGERLDLVGLDWSQPALRHMTQPAVCASSAALPLPRGRFDMILCSELLEHISEESWQTTLDEMKRLAPRYLLLSVPNNENIHTNQVKCPQCNAIFNVSHHFRSFSLDSLVACFPGYQLRESRVGGPGVRAYPRLLLWLRQQIGRRWFQVPDTRTAVCARCDNRHFPRTGYNPVSFVCDGINRLISRRHPYWLYVLLEIAR
jgi:SAM-dependent methyltransferase